MIVLSSCDEDRPHLPAFTVSRSGVTCTEMPGFVPTLYDDNIRPFSRVETKA